MLLASLFAPALVVAVAAEPLASPGDITHLTIREKMAATEPLTVGY